MTDNFGVYNSKRAKEPTLVCSECGIKISSHSKSGLCVSCSHKHKRENAKTKYINRVKIICPCCKTNLMNSTSTMRESCYNKKRIEKLYNIISRDNLKELIRSTSFTKLAICIMLVTIQYENGVINIIYQEKYQKYKNIQKKNG